MGISQEQETAMLDQPDWRDEYYAGGFSIERDVLDHMGATYFWFEDVYEDDGNLHIAVAPDSWEEADTENYAEGPYRWFTPEEVMEAIVKLDDEWGEGTYEGNYFYNLRQGNYDIADGDMNTADMILQTLAFGELVFG